MLLETSFSALMFHRERLAAIVESSFVNTFEASCIALIDFVFRSSFAAEFVWAGLVFLTGEGPDP